MEKIKKFNVSKTIRDNEFVTILKLDYEDGISSIKKSYSSDSSINLIKFFRDEVKFLELLKDTKIVPKLLKAKYKKEELFEIETEFINGKTLFDFFYKKDSCSGYYFNESIDYKRRFNYAIKIAKAVKKIHKCGVVHRDIKPNNIIIKNGKVYLIDFGISCFNGKVPFCPSGNKFSSYYQRFERNRKCHYNDDVYELSHMLYKDFGLNKYCIGLDSFFSEYNDKNTGKDLTDDLIKNLEKGLAKYNASLGTI